MSDSVELKGVVETLMIPLWARALATQQQGLIDDPAAVDLVKRLEYDFEAKLGHARWLASFSVVRARRFDEAVRDFIDKYPDGAVVELGCGLDTRWERCDGQRVDWFDLDLDAAIALRRRYFRDGERRKMIAAPLQDAGWHDRVGPRDRPFLFVSEGVLLYLEPDEVAEFISSVSRSFPASSILLDTIGTGTINRQDSHPLMRNYEARFRWAVDDVSTLVADNPYSVVSVDFLADLRPEELRCLSLTSRLLLLVFRRMRWFRESSSLVCVSSLDA